MNRKKFIITASIILLSILIFWLGGVHFSKNYLIGRNVPFKKLKTMNCDWKDNGGYGITGYGFFDKTMCEVKNDTLYLGGEPKAKIVSLVHRYLALDYELTIPSFDGIKKGEYNSK